MQCVVGTGISKETVADRAITLKGYTECVYPVPRKSIWPFLSSFSVYFSHLHGSDHQTHLNIKQGQPK